MPGVDVTRADWPDFLSAFSHQHDGWLVSIDRYQPDARARHREGALRGVTLEDPRGEAIAVRIDDAATGRRETERVVGPRRVLLEQTSDRIDAGLEIDAADGRLSLRIHRPMPVEMVDGIP